MSTCVIFERQTLEECPTCQHRLQMIYGSGIVPSMRCQRCAWRLSLTQYLSEIGPVACSYDTLFEYVNSRTGERAPAFVPDIPNHEINYATELADAPTIDEMWEKMERLGITRD